MFEAVHTTIILIFTVSATETALYAHNGPRKARMVQTRQPYATGQNNTKNLIILTQVKLCCTKLLTRIGTR